MNSYYPKKKKRIKFVFASTTELAVNFKLRVRTRRSPFPLSNSDHLGALGVGSCQLVLVLARGGFARGEGWIVCDLWHAMALTFSITILSFHSLFELRFSPKGWP